MTKELLMKDFGLTEEQADKVMAALDGAFVTKSRFDTVNAEVKQLKETLEGRNEQLESLKKESGTAEKLKAQIEEMQAANTQREKEHASEMKRLKREALDERLLTEAKAINALAVKPFLGTIDDSVDDEGYTALRKQQIEALSKAETTKFLFRAEGEGGDGFVGVNPGETGTPPVTTGGTNPFDSKTYDEAAQIKLFRENPERAKAMAKQAGLRYL
jgi:hypothetical protein